MAPFSSAQKDVNSADQVHSQIFQDAVRTQGPTAASWDILAAANFRNSS
jgi:hypothetical protein